MKIREYDELDGQQVLELNQGGLGWFLSPERAEKIRKLDPHVPGYFALYAVERGKVVSQVGVVLVDTETVSGKEKIGFVWGVCTAPSKGRRGYAGDLMGEAHSRINAEGVRYSLLCTSQGFVAHNLYRKLGYKDFLGLGWSVKRCTPVKRPPKDIIYTTTSSNGVFSALFARYSEGFLGFIHRPSNFLQLKKTWGWPPIDVTGQFQRNDKTIGYVIAAKEGRNIKVRELCTLNPGDVQQCLKCFEFKYKPRYLFCELLEGSHGEKICDRLGIIRRIDTWGGLMIKDLKGAKSIRDLYKLYGIGRDRFLMSSMDEY